jgi:hypothetical protein
MGDSIESKKRGKTTEGDVETEIKKSKKGGFSSINSLHRFKEVFTPQGWVFPIERKFTVDAVAPWGSKQGTRKLAQWLVSQAGEWASTYNIIRNKPNERSLYPLLFEVLKSLLLTVDCQISDVRMADEAPSDIDVQAAIARFVGAKTPSSSRAHSIDKHPDATSPCGDESVGVGVGGSGCGDGALPSSSDPGRLSDIQMVDITNEDAVTGLYVEIERYIREEIEGSKARGHAEFFIKNFKTKMTLAAFEVKSSLSADDEAGLYQIVSELISVSKSNSSIAEDLSEHSIVAPAFVYGVYTDTRNFQFVRIGTQDQSIALSRVYGFFGSASDLVMDADATVVAAYLFHILGIPSDVDVNETIRNLQVNKKTMGVHCSRVCTVALGSA